MEPDNTQIDTNTAEEIQAVTPALIAPPHEDVALALAKTMYEAYDDTVPYNDYGDWDDMPDGVRQAWKAAALHAYMNVASRLKLEFAENTSIDALYSIYRTADELMNGRLFALERLRALVPAEETSKCYKNSLDLMQVELLAVSRRKMAEVVFDGKITNAYVDAYGYSGMAQAVVNPVSTISSQEAIPDPSN